MYSSLILMAVIVSLLYYGEKEAKSQREPKSWGAWWKSMGAYALAGGAILCFGYASRIEGYKEAQLAASHLVECAASFVEQPTKAEAPMPQEFGEGEEK